MADNTEIVLVYLIGTFGMIILSGAIFFFFTTYQKRLLKKELEINRIKTIQQEEILKNTVLSQEKERKRIAQDLHDEVGAMLSVVKLNISMFERNADNEGAKQIAAETKSYLDNVILQVRRISRALMPPSLEKLGLAAAAQELINWINKSDQIQVEFWESGKPYRFGVDKEIAVFRIIQELLNNAIKHSKGNRVSLKMRFSKNCIAVSVCDNGQGFDMKNNDKSGLGLKNLESRRQILDAKIKLRSAIGKGTSVIILINPLNQMKWN